MSTAGGSDLLATLGVEPTSPTTSTEVDVDAADDGQSDVERSEGADEVKYDEAAPMTMVGGADALELAYHAARGVEPTAAWEKSSSEAYPGDEQYASILARSACEAMHIGHVADGRETPEGVVVTSTPPTRKRLRSGSTTDPTTSPPKTHRRISGRVWLCKPMRR